MKSDLENSIKPVFEFEWSNGRVRRTDELKNDSSLGEAGVHTLARLGEEDPDCTVRHVGYES